MNIGKIIGQSNSKHIILRSTEGEFEKKLPDIGEKVYTAEKQRIGIIADIFGPVNKPFVSVKPYTSESDLLLKFNLQKGSSLFTLARKQTFQGNRTKSQKYKAKTIPPKKKSFHQKKKKPSQSSQKSQSLTKKNS